MPRTSPDAYKAACRALLRAFDSDNPNPEQAIDDAAAALVEEVPPAPLNDLNDGQFAAVVDYIIQYTPLVFASRKLRNLIVGGNLTLALDYLGDDKRGMARRDVWNVGNSQ